MSMKKLDEHKVNPANDMLEIYATDEPGAGGAYHRYMIVGATVGTNPSATPVDRGSRNMSILFQNGPIKEVGVNGITHEALLAIVADRLRAFQDGEYACKENACALTHIEEALHWLHSRTLKRMRRGVEGTHTV